LRADGWAGCAIAKNDLNSTGLADALTAVSKYTPVSHPPSWPMRLAALRLGYVHCGGDGAKFDRASGSKSK
jgi:hypothetical protein